MYFIKQISSKNLKAEYFNMTCDNAELIGD